MKLKLDNTKTYAIALEGGGAMGAYHIGAWQALREAGIKFNAVAGTSVGALNGALMCMGDFQKAVDVWKDIRFSDVVSLDEDAQKDIQRLLRGEAEVSDIKDILHHLAAIIKNRGLDVSPLRSWVRELVDCEAIRNSHVELFITTVSLTDRKGLEIKINDLGDDEMRDMLLASAYHPSFRLERLGGKHYADGGFVDSLPISVLVEHGYKDIIGVRLPSSGLEKPYKIPADGSLTLIQTNSDLGNVLNFDAEQSRKDMLVGYLDTKRVLYGLYGEKYYIERRMSEREALNALIDRYYDGSVSLRKFCQLELPVLSVKFDSILGDYYDVFINALEKEAESAGIDKMDIYTDSRLFELISKRDGGENG